MTEKTDNTPDSSANQSDKKDTSGGEDNIPLLSEDFLAFMAVKNKIQPVPYLDEFLQLIYSTVPFQLQLTICNVFNSQGKNMEFKDVCVNKNSMLNYSQKDSFYISYFDEINEEKEIIHPLGQQVPMCNSFSNICTFKQFKMEMVEKTNIFNKNVLDQLNIVDGHSFEKSNNCFIMFDREDIVLTGTNQLIVCLQSNKNEDSEKRKELAYLKLFFKMLQSFNLVQLSRQLTIKAKADVLNAESHRQPIQIYSDPMEGEFTINGMDDLHEDIVTAKFPSHSVKYVYLDSTYEYKGCAEYKPDYKQCVVTMISLKDQPFRLYFDPTSYKSSIFGKEKNKCVFQASLFSQEVQWHQVSLFVHFFKSHRTQQFEQVENAGDLGYQSREMIKAIESIWYETLTEINDISAVLEDTIIDLKSRLLILFIEYIGINNKMFIHNFLLTIDQEYVKVNTKLSKNILESWRRRKDDKIDKLELTLLEGNKVDIMMHQNDMFTDQNDLQNILMKVHAVKDEEKTKIDPEMLINFVPDISPQYKKVNYYKFFQKKGQQHNKDPFLFVQTHLDQVSFILTKAKFKASISSQLVRDYKTILIADFDTKIANKYKLVWLSIFEQMINTDLIELASLNGDKLTPGETALKEGIVAVHLQFANELRDKTLSAASSEEQRDLVSDKEPLEFLDWFKTNQKGKIVKEKYFEMSQMFSEEYISSTMKEFLNFDAESMQSEMFLFQDSISDQIDMELMLMIESLVKKQQMNGTDIFKAVYDMVVQDQVSKNELMCLIFTQYKINDIKNEENIKGKIEELLIMGSQDTPTILNQSIEFIKDKYKSNNILINKFITQYLNGEFKSESSAQNSLFFQQHIFDLQNKLNINSDSFKIIFWERFGTMLDVTNKGKSEMKMLLSNPKSYKPDCGMEVDTPKSLSQSTSGTKKAIKKEIADLKAIKDELVEDVKGLETVCPGFEKTFNPTGKSDDVFENLLIPAMLVYNFQKVNEVQWNSKVVQDQGMKKFEGIYDTVVTALDENKLETLKENKEQGDMIKSIDFLRPDSQSFFKERFTTLKGLTGEGQNRLFIIQQIHNRFNHIFKGQFIPGSGTREQLVSQYHHSLSSQPMIFQRVKMLISNQDKHFKTQVDFINVNFGYTLDEQIPICDKDKMNIYNDMIQDLKNIKNIEPIKELEEQNAVFKDIKMNKISELGYLKKLITGLRMKYDKMSEDDSKIDDHNKIKNFLDNLDSIDMPDPEVIANSFHEIHSIEKSGFVIDDSVKGRNDSGADGKAGIDAGVDGENGNRVDGKSSLNDLDTDSNNENESKIPSDFEELKNLKKEIPEDNSNSTSSKNIQEKFDFDAKYDINKEPQKIHKIYSEGVPFHPFDLHKLETGGDHDLTKIKTENFSMEEIKTNRYPTNEFYSYTDPRYNHGNLNIQKIKTESNTNTNTNKSSKSTPQDIQKIFTEDPDNLVMHKIKTEDDSLKRLSTERLGDLKNHPFDLRKMGTEIPNDLLHKIKTENDSLKKIGTEMPNDLLHKIKTENDSLKKIKTEAQNLLLRDEDIFDLLKIKTSLPEADMNKIKADVMTVYKIITEDLDQLNDDANLRKKKQKEIKMMNNIMMNPHLSKIQKIKAISELLDQDPEVLEKIETEQMQNHTDHELKKIHTDNHDLQKIHTEGHHWDEIKRINTENHSEGKRDEIHIIKTEKDSGQGLKMNKIETESIMFNKAKKDLENDENKKEKDSMESKSEITKKPTKMIDMNKIKTEPEVQSDKSLVKIKTEDHVKLDIEKIPTQEISVNPVKPVNKPEIGSATEDNSAQPPNVVTPDVKPETINKNLKAKETKNAVDAIVDDLNLSPEAKELYNDLSNALAVLGNLVSFKSIGDQSSDNLVNISDNNLSISSSKPQPLINNSKKENGSDILDQKYQGGSESNSSIIKSDQSRQDIFKWAQFNINSFLKDQEMQTRFKQEANIYDLDDIRTSIRNQGLIDQAYDAAQETNPMKAEARANGVENEEPIIELNDEEKKFIIKELLPALDIKELPEGLKKLDQFKNDVDLDLKKNIQEFLNDSTQIDAKNVQEMFSKEKTYEFLEKLKSMENSSRLRLIDLFHQKFAKTKNIMEFKQNLSAVDISRLKSIGLEDLKIAYLDSFIKEPQFDSLSKKLKNTNSNILKEEFNVILYNNAIQGGKDQDFINSKENTLLTRKDFDELKGNEANEVYKLLKKDFDSGQIGMIWLHFQNSPEVLVELLNNDYLVLGTVLDLIAHLKFNLIRIGNVPLNQHLFSEKIDADTQQKVQKGLIPDIQIKLMKHLDYSFDNIKFQKVNPEAILKDYSNFKLAQETINKLQIKHEIDIQDIKAGNQPKKNEPKHQKIARNIPFLKQYPDIIKDILMIPVNQDGDIFLEQMAEEGKQFYIKMQKQMETQQPLTTPVKDKVNKEDIDKVAAETEEHDSSLENTHEMVKQKNKQQNEGKTFRYHQSMDKKIRKSRKFKRKKHLMLSQNERIKGNFGQEQKDKRRRLLSKQFGQNRFKTVKNKFQISIKKSNSLSTWKLKKLPIIQRVNVPKIYPPLISNIENRKLQCKNLNLKFQDQVQCETDIGLCHYMCQLQELKKSSGQISDCKNNCLGNIRSQNEDNEKKKQGK